MTLYILCYDLKETTQKQAYQIAYWLDFLNSALFLPLHNNFNNARWSIMIAGLRSDLQPHLSSSFQLHHLNAWQKKWPKLPITGHLNTISSHKSQESIQCMLKEVEKECHRIFNKHAIEIPTSYHNILRKIQHHYSVEQNLVHWKVLHQKCDSEMDERSFRSVLQYLEAIGRIVWLKQGMVFPDPTQASKIVAKFISPENICLSLLKKDTEKVQILTTEEIGCLLDIDTSNNEKFIFQFLIAFPFSYCFF